MTWKHWLYGMVSAAISAGANSITVMIVAPETFNINEGLPKVGMVAAVAAFTGVANYLKQSPLPGSVTEDKKEG
jgi:hypothetical protein